jgi:segregation and condensation protein B
MSNTNDYDDTAGWVTGDLPPAAPEPEAQDARHPLVASRPIGDARESHGPMLAQAKLAGSAAASQNPSDSDTDDVAPQTPDGTIGQPHKAGTLLTLAGSTGASEDGRTDSAASRGPDEPAVDDIDIPATLAHSTPLHASSARVAGPGDYDLSGVDAPGAAVFAEETSNGAVSPARQIRGRGGASAEIASDLPATASAAQESDLTLDALIEGLLFVADGPVSVARLAEALEVSARDVEASLAVLSGAYHRRGLSLQRFRDKVQLTTAPGAAGRVERFLGLAAATPLSRAALEALAIIAYQQPVTRPQIEAVRGVNSDSVIKNLLVKGLVEETGRAEGPGRPVLYITTTEFMQHFGLSSLADLPPLTPPEPESNGAPGTALKG